MSNGKILKCQVHISHLVKNKNKTGFLKHMGEHKKRTICDLLATYGNGD